MSTVDFEPAFELVREVVQLGPAAFPDRADDVPAFPEELGRHCMAEAARRADDEDCT
ncbi:MULTISPECIES: hypothetical protein [unclassified Mesorhizobium]|uniref:hypothetical protein n=1 Tax=unclassified Mesorhizobium TaxID=325217 RepID=UPI001FEE8C60|nr:MULTISPECIES: hypothetical protein [unclassified Mesorhizobium]